MYHRFSVDGLGVVGLGDAKKIGVLQTQTLAYLRQKRTVGQLESCVDALVHKERAIPRRLRPTSIPELTKMEHDCLRALYSAGGSYDTQRVAVERAVPGTCEWFLGHPDFVDWVSSDAAGVLWVTANAGCGKSVMSGFLADALASTERNLTVCSFFFKGGQDHRHEAYNGLCALLHQGILADPSAASLAATQFSSKEPGAFSEALEQLWSVFCRLAEQSPRPVVCILDALDECSAASRDRLIGLLAASFGGPDSKTPAPKNLKFLVTSRPYPEIEERFHSLRAIRLRGEDEAAAVSRDVESVVRHRVDEMRRRSALSPEGCALVEATLLRRAGATFLWVALVLDLLARLPSRKLRAVRELLEQIPDDLEQLYEHGLAGTPRPDDTRRLLQILLVGSRPLRVEEVNIALNIREGTATLRDLDDELEPNAEYAIGLLGRFFVKISQGFVFLVHETAREFLLREASHAAISTSGWKHSLDELDCNAVLAEACMQYLLLDGWPTRPDLPRTLEARNASNIEFLADIQPTKRTFFLYASEMWANLVQRTGERQARAKYLEELARQLCDVSTGPFRGWWYFYDSENFYFGPSPLYITEACSAKHYIHFAANRGDTAIVRGMAAASSSISEQNPRGFDVLVVATARERTPLVGWLLATFKQDEMQCGTAMLCAIHFRNMELVRRFFEAGVDLNTAYLHPLRDGKDAVYELPLTAAVSCPPIRDFLLASGAKINDDSLTTAAELGRVDTLQVFLEVADEREERERVAGLRRAADAATKACELEARDYLIERFPVLGFGSDLSAALAEAAKRQDPDEIGRILDSGARDDSGDALKWAAVMGDLRTVTTLLERVPYARRQLDAALRGFFEEVMPTCMESHILARLRQCLSSLPAGARQHQLFRIKPRLGGGIEVSSNFLSAMMERGVSLQQAVFDRAMVCAAAMDEDLAVFMIESLERLLDARVGASRYLSLACLWGRERLAEKICGKEAAVDELGMLGVPPLLAAVISGNKSIVRALLDRRADPGEAAKPRRVWNREGGAEMSEGQGVQGDTVAPICCGNFELCRRATQSPGDAAARQWDVILESGLFDGGETGIGLIATRLGFDDIEEEVRGFASRG